MLSNPATALTSFMVDPGERIDEIALFISGLGAYTSLLLGCRLFQSSLLIPAANRFGSNLGSLARARIFPVFTSIATAAPEVALGYGLSFTIPFLIFSIVFARESSAVF